MTRFSKAQIAAITDAMIDEGKVIEAGWFGLRAMIFPDGAPEIQLTEMRSAFFAGAQHLFSSIMHVMDPGEEPSENDMARMALIDHELREFIKDFEMRHVKTAGSA